MPVPAIPRVHRARGLIRIPYRPDGARVQDDRQLMRMHVDALYTHDARGRMLRVDRREPLYSTSWENAASRALAARLGLRRFGADLQIA